MNAAVTLVVLAVAAATFVLSYAGVHAIALQGGVSVQLARVYPGVFDAVLVIACVAAVALRDARWWARCWAWLVAIVVLGAIGTTDVLHAMSYALRHRPTEGVVAAAPVVAVLLAFSLLLTMLRQSRPQASDAVPVVAAGLVHRPPAPPISLPPTHVVLVVDEPEAADAVAETQEIPVSVGDVSGVSEVSEAVEAGEDIAAPGTAPAREEPVLLVPAPAAPDPDLVLTSDEPAAPDDTVPPDDTVAPDDPHPPTEPNEVVAAEPPTQLTPAPWSAPQAIRYASSAAAEAADDYWDSDVDPALAGQVYPVLTSDPDIDTSGYRPDKPKDVDDSDAPPFATAPFASVPRLNRMRVTPTPPTDNQELD